MALSFSMIASQLLVDRDSVLRALSWPVLVWEARPLDPGALGYDDSTESGNHRPRRPTTAEPLLLEVRKRPLGSGPDINVGRMTDNDIVLEDVTVSRTHAAFRRETLTGVWAVLDAESHNGTFLDGVLIVPGRPMPLFDRARVRFGDVEVAFFQPAGFEQYVRARAARVPVRLTRAG
ncbi:FHA domain-containing protein [Myxococcaceae bacterium GXIMD 01537]